MEKVGVEVWRERDIQKRDGCRSKKEKGENGGREREKGSWRLRERRGEMEIWKGGHVRR